MSDTSFACGFCGEMLAGPGVTHTLSHCARHLHIRIAELEKKATADREYMDAAEKRIAELEAKVAEAHRSSADWASGWVQRAEHAEAELAALRRDSLLLVAELCVRCISRTAGSQPNACSSVGSRGEVSDEQSPKVPARVWRVVWRGS